MKDWLFVDYWPWWFAGPALGGLVIAMWVLERRSLGVSGIIAQVIKKESQEDKAFRSKAENDKDALEEAMMRATLEEFGEEAVAAFAAEMADEEEEEAQPNLRAALPLSTHATFLLMLVAGGAVGALVSGGLEIRSTLGATHQALTGGGVLSMVALVIGGIFVGFGTRMSGGCTSGHGLSGCSRMQPASLLATASFFGTAVAVSFLLRALV
jgi:hypothetical protein